MLFSNKPLGKNLRDKQHYSCKIYAGNAFSLEVSCKNFPSQKAYFFAGYQCQKPFLGFFSGLLSSKPSPYKIDLLGLKNLKPGFRLKVVTKVSQDSFRFVTFSLRISFDNSSLYNSIGDHGRFFQAKVVKIDFFGKPDNICFSICVFSLGGGI